MTHPKFPRKMKKAARKLQAHVVGFTGVGPTGLDDTSGPKPTWREKRKYAHAIQEAKKFHQDCFRQACIDVLGEDPDDWDKIPDDYDDGWR